MVAAFKPKLLLSIHSFNETYEGQRRDMEIGVLCNESSFPADEVRASQEGDRCERRRQLQC